MSLSYQFLKKISTVLFTGFTDIDKYFRVNTKLDFISWFNHAVAGRGAWLKTGSRLPLAFDTDTLTRRRFNRLWDQESIHIMFGENKITLLQFIALQIVILDKVGGSLVPIIEKGSNVKFSGLDYLFNSVSSQKPSYNTLAGNKTCYELFNDPDYNRAFHELPPGKDLMYTANQVWTGEVYPATVSLSTHPDINGYLLEADFYKFRGRGFIPVTGRRKYAVLIDYIINQYEGNSQLINRIRTQWRKLSLDPDTIATISTNADWDALFQESDGIIAARAVAVHNSTCEIPYLNKLDDETEDAISNSVYNMGKCILGTNNYAISFENRILQVLELLQ